MRAKTAIALFGAATLGAALWWRKNPSACPYGQRFWVEAPHPVITRDRLRSVLAPEPGERVLEIGPGTGYYTLDMAEWVGPDGRVEIFDLQQEFLDHVVRRAAKRGLANVVPTQGDATALPYEDASMDAVVLTAVLGEIPDPGAALREIRRVLKPGGRLVVGELFGDPHFTTRAGLERQAAKAGLAYETHSGNWLAYFELQEQAVAAIPFAPERVLELGMGTGETTRRLIEAYPDAWVVGLDSSPDMVFRARQTYDDVQLARMEDPLPDGPWDLVISVLSVNDLTDEQKQSLFRRVKDHSRSLVIGDAFENDQLSNLVKWCNGEITWQADGLAVVRAAY